ncbi:matrix metalloproteinase-17-like isoform X1 [Ambystoma mexicanum]|uniref:matrix metalloproteinase-17-like isoform X1 n=1 Tax=Ambystoma mexicanum TaxID=8296 RepID=UPI0037E75494
MGRPRCPGPPRGMRELRGETLLLRPVLLLCTILQPVAATPVPTPADESGEVVDWLTRYGYLPPPDPITGKLQTWEAVTGAIRSMQHFAGINETGMADNATLELIRMPRCSLPDLRAAVSEEKDRIRQSGGTRVGRSVGSTWTKKNLSWKVKTYPRRAKLSRETMRVLMYYALKVWSEAVPLTFHEVGARSPDISVEFIKSEHQDGYPFDGAGGMVAHAFFPGDPQRAGNVHFDSDENWTFRSPDDFGTDLFAVAVHEFGHSLGLAHSSLKRSIMRPYYQGPVGDPLQFQLSSDDRSEIQKLYGSRDPHSTQLPEVTSFLPDLPALPRERPALRFGKDVPDRCTSGIDAATQIRGETFFFKGRFFWRLTHAHHLTSLRPARISGFWRGLPSSLEKLDAVYERHLDHHILFFSGSQYWVFKDNGAEDGYPRPVSDFGLPDSGVDGAFSRPQDWKTYFFKDGQHWRYDEMTKQMDPGYPVADSTWTHLPSPVDDVINGPEGEIYVFKGTEYWKLGKHTQRAETGYPRSIAEDWMDCIGDKIPEQRGVTSSPSSGAKNHQDSRGPELELDRCLCYNSRTDTGSGGTVETASPSLLLVSLLTMVASWR